MARKSSKTSHVMNLLAGDNSDSESPKSEAAKENLAAKTANSKETIKELTVLAQQASIQTQDGPSAPSPISIIDMSSTAPDPVAELIKEELEKEENTEKETLLPVTEPTDSDSEELSELEQEKLEQEKPEQEKPEQEPIQEQTYQYLNIMESVVENILEEYMGKFQVCTCGHCVADVMALTLSNLPPKYIVVERTAVSPLLNFYSSRFAQQVIVELTKACTMVKENPRH